MTGSGESSSQAIRALVDELAEFLGRSVVVNDPQVRALYSSRHFDDEDPVRIRAIMQHDAGADVVAYVLDQGIASWSQPGRIPASPELGLSARLCVALRIGNRFLGSVMVIDADHDLTDSEIARIEAASEEIGAEFASQAAADDKVRGRRAALLRDAISSDAAIRVPAVRELESLGFGEHARLTVSLVEVTSSRHNEAQIEMAMRSPDSGIDPGVVSRGIAVIDGRSAHSLRRITTSGSSEELRSQATRSRQALARILGAQARVSVGIGGLVSSPTQVHISYRQARVALRAAHRVSTFEGIGLWDDLSELAPLLCLDDLPPDSRGERALRLLDGHEAGARLRETLTVYLDEAGSAPRAARALNLHRTSLYYRLNQIQDFTGLDLASGRDRLALHLQLRLDAIDADDR